MDRTPIEDKHPDVLQNIEFAIVSLYKEDQRLLDLDALDAIEKLIRDYTLEEQGRVASRTVLSERADRLFHGVHDVCEWRLGRRIVKAPGDGDIAPTPIPLSEMLLCLKRIRKSINRWTSVRGRQGYLRYVQQFIDDPESALEKELGL